MNSYIKILKDNLYGYDTNRRSLDRYYVDDSKCYTGDMLKSRQNEYKGKKVALKKKIEKQIVDDFNETKALISKASAVKPSAVMSDTYRMFHEDMISLDEHEVQTFIDKARKDNDFTTLRAIKEYSDKHKLYLNIPTAASVVDGYKKFYESALELVDKIDNETIQEAECVSVEVADFANETGVSQELYSKIGSDYFPNVNDLPNELSHTFDSVALQKNGHDFAASDMPLSFAGISNE